ncbi:hypothetical protein [[Scytonema hofmanni] UTEX B 1581]|uniref:hypothetical protein n=1 Tax=[Scytonema hofmanni] UTEX B 1581 TaxID=379535 RepID=UPI0004B7AA40|nr:hypothetical protein [[Scytonema hofmanni] UTEX B 1581]
MVIGLTQDDQKTNRTTIAQKPARCVFSQGTFSGEASPEKLPPRCSDWRDTEE